MDRLYDVFEVYLGNIDTWRILKTKDPDTFEQFEPLTLLNSFIESEMDLEFSFRLLDRVIDRLEPIANSTKKTLQFSDVHTAVVQCLLELNDSNHDTTFYLSNYENIFGPDLEGLSKDSQYINVRNASELRAFIVDYYANDLGEEPYLERTELRAITNRLKKLIRYSGFYSVRREFLTDFLDELSRRSVKGFLPNKSISKDHISDILQTSEQGIKFASMLIRQQPQRAIGTLEVSLAELSRVLLAFFGAIPGRPGKHSLAQLKEIISATFIRGELNDSALPMLQSVKNKISSSLEKQGLSISSFYEDADALLEALHNRKVTQAVELSQRLFEQFKIILEEGDRIEKLLSFNPRNSTEPLITILADVITRFETEMVESKKGSYLNININNSYHSLLDFGRTLRIRTLFPEERDGMDAYNFEGEISDLHNDDDVIPVIVIERWLGGAFKSNLLSLVEQNNRMIAVLYLTDLTRMVSKNEDLRSIIHEQIKGLYPFSRQLGTSVYKMDWVIPEHLDVTFRSNIAKLLADIDRGRINDAALQAGKICESIIFEYALQLYSIIVSSPKHRKLVNSLESWGLNNIIHWLSKLGENSELQEIKLLLPRKALIRSMYDLKDTRNEATHVDDNFDFLYVNNFIKGIVKLKSEVSKILSNLKLHEGVTVGREVIVKTKETELKKSTDKIACGVGGEFLAYIYSVNSVKHLAIAHVDCRKRNCNHISPVTNFNEKGQVTCQASNCNYRFVPHRNLKDYQMNMNHTKNTAQLSNSPSNSKAHNWLNIIGEGLVVALGPFGAPLKSYLTHLQIEQQERLNQSLTDFIQNDKSDTSFELPEHIENREIFSGLIVQLIETAINDHGRENLGGIYKQLSSNKWPYFSISNVLENDVIEELKVLYAHNMDLLKTELSMKGFDCARVRWTGTPLVDISAVILGLRGQNPEFTFSIVEQLQMLNPGSHIFVKVKHSFSERLEELRQTSIQYK